ncbi:MAG: hypothetical protein K2R98_04565 [Gemmataceae bacterium]|nr:hypothetical protein [Gemmataceae bacterium]
MSEAITPTPDAHPAPRIHPTTHGRDHASLFTPAEIDAMRADDYHAAGYIVKLMVSIFIAGTILYSIVAISCWK